MKLRRAQGRGRAPARRPRPRSRLVGLTGGRPGPLADAPARGGDSEAAGPDPRSACRHLRPRRLLVDVQRHRRARRRREPALLDLADAARLPLVATNRRSTRGRRAARCSTSSPASARSRRSSRRPAAPGRERRAPPEIAPGDGAASSRTGPSARQRGRAGRRLRFTLEDLGYDSRTSRCRRAPETHRATLREMTETGARDRYGAAATRRARGARSSASWPSSRSSTSPATS